MNLSFPPAIPAIFVSRSGQRTSTGRKNAHPVKLFDREPFAFVCRRKENSDKHYVKIRLNLDGSLETCCLRIGDLARQLHLSKSSIVESAQNGQLENLLLTWKNFIPLLKDLPVPLNDLIALIQSPLHSIEGTAECKIDPSGLVAFKNRMTHLVSVVQLQNLKEILGIGKFGTVWKVADLTNREIFAFKTTAPSVLDQLKEGDELKTYFEVSQTSLENEFQIVRELNPDGTLVGIELPSYIMLTLTHGKVKYKGILKVFYEQSIQLPIERREFSLKEKLMICSQLIAGYDTLSEKGIWFADIKPDNVRQFPLPDGSCRYDLCDLGSARRYRAIDPQNLGAYTPYYFPLEDRKRIAQTTDRKILEEICRAQSCFALGAVLFEVMTNQKPFFQEEKGELKYPIIPENLKRQNLDLSDHFKDSLHKNDLVTIILNMLNKNYKERTIPPNASQLFKIASDFQNL